MPTNLPIMKKPDKISKPLWSTIPLSKPGSPRTSPATFTKGTSWDVSHLDLAGTERQCKLQLTLSDVDLDDLMTSSDPNAPARKPTQGMLNGSLSVSTSTKGTSPLLGRWCFEITQMQAGYVTTLAKILSVLQLSEPQEIVFERILVKFLSQGRHPLSRTGRYCRG